MLLVSSTAHSVLLQLHNATAAARHWCKLLHTATTVTFSYTHCRGNTRQATISISTEQRDKRKCLPPMQVSLQPTHRLADRKMKPKHCVSNWAYWNRTLDNQIYYTKSQYFEIVLNYRIVEIFYFRWQKFFSRFRRRIRQPIGKYIVIRNVFLWAVCK